MFSTLPEGLARWTDKERDLFLQATLAIAGVAPRQARVFYDGLPPALERLTAQERQALLRASQFRCKAILLRYLRVSHIEVRHF